MQSTNPPRPTGVTIIAILAIVIGIIGLLGGALLIGASAIFASTPLFGLGGILAGLTMIIAGVVLFFGFIWLLVGWGFLNGRGWAWTVGLIFSFLSIIFDIFAVTTGQWSAAVGLLLWILMVYYLFTGPVKSFFGKGPAIPPSYSASPSTPRPSIPTATFGPSIGSSLGKFSSSSGSMSRTCSNCGAPVGSGLSKCSNCGAPL